MTSKEHKKDIQDSTLAGLENVRGKGEGTSCDFGSNWTPSPHITHLDSFLMQSHSSITSDLALILLASYSCRNHFQANTVLKTEN